MYPNSSYPGANSSKELVSYTTKKLLQYANIINDYEKIIESNPYPEIIADMHILKTDFNYQDLTLKNVTYIECLKLV